jgi:hypothetical protein
LPLRGAQSAAAAFAHVRARYPHEWLLFAPEDAYLPRGSGNELAAVLASIEPAHRSRTVVGFPLTVEGQTLRDTGAGMQAFDSGAVVVHRDLPVMPEPSLGWASWGALARNAAIAPQLVRAPVFFARELSNRSSIAGL